MHFEPFNAEAPEPHRRYFDDVKYLQLDEEAGEDAEEMSDDDKLMETMGEEGGE